MQAEGIESANIVGYTTQAVGDMKFAMVGVQFQGAGDANGEIAINDFIKGDFAAVDYDDFDEFLTTAPEIQVWDGGGYTFYYYLNAHNGYETGWCDDWGDYSDAKFAPGTAVWFRAKTGACTITTPGQVVSEDETTIVCTDKKFTMVANALPVALDLNDASQVTYNGLVAVDYDENDEFLTTAPEIQVWDGGGYTFYYYLNAHNGYEAGWCDDWGDLVSGAVIPVGRGFWTRARTGEFSFSFNK